MRKLSFLFLGFIAIVSFVSCTKENLQTSQTSNQTNSPAFSVTYSEWTMDANFDWEDGTAGNNPAKQTNWDAFDLTQQTIDGEGVLVYAKSNIDGSIQPMPTSFTKGTDETVLDFYEFVSIPGFISIIHSKSVDGVFETPANTNEMSFKFIFVNPNVAPSNARIPTNNGSYSLADLRNFSYEEVITLLGIPE
ncbi:MAG: hypothetical protein M3413_14765 [Bacteroidota bacterium]|nr:hypothetical protein [Bacteroidota bacterium]